MARTHNFWLYGCQLCSSLRLRIAFRRRVQICRTARRQGATCHSWNSSIELSHGHDSYGSTWYPTQISITQCTSASASSFLQSIFSIRTLKLITQGRIVTTVAANPRILRPQRRWAVSWRALLPFHITTQKICRQIEKSSTVHETKERGRKACHQSRCQSTSTSNLIEIISVPESYYYPFIPQRHKIYHRNV